MCCRYYMELSPELRPIIEEANRSSLLARMISILARPMVTEGEVRPSDIVPTLASDRRKKPAVFPMVWGFAGRNSLLVNARSETAKERPTFQDSWRNHRCVIPASWYFEWEHLINPDGKKRTGAKYSIQPTGSRMMYLAGLYRMEEKDGLRYPVFVVLTREPWEEIRFIHDRMPVILPPSAVAAWIDPNGNPDEIIGAALSEMSYVKAV